MKTLSRLCLFTLLACGVSWIPLLQAEVSKVPSFHLENTIPAVVPPAATPLPNDLAQPLRDRIAAVAKMLPPEKEASLTQWPDPHRTTPDLTVRMILKAVQDALDHHEFYDPAKDVPKAQALLDYAEGELKRRDVPESRIWRPGKHLAAFRSMIDDSLQPMGLEVPEDFDPKAPLKVVVWLHGRGDKETPFHFLARRLQSSGDFHPKSTLILHPNGRGCLGFKGPGSTDIEEAVAWMKVRAEQQGFQIENARFLLAGFSMGGAGAWHVAARNPEPWVAMHAGAGFVDVKRYLKLDPKMVPWYQRVLWSRYDVPDLVENLFNLPVLTYGGELDKQKEASEIMVEAYREKAQQLSDEEKRTLFSELIYEIGVEMPHKYHPESKAKIQAWMEAQLEAPLRAEYRPAIRRFADPQQRPILWPSDREGKLTAPLNFVPWTSQLQKVTHPAHIRLTSPESLNLHFTPVPKVSPIPDDAFNAPFVVVLPDELPSDPVVRDWMQKEMAHQASRWERTFTGTWRMKKVSELSEEDLSQRNLVLWGDPEGNALIKKWISKLPVEWTDKVIRIGEHQVDAKGHVPVLAYPNPEHPNRIIVLNSGPTFRVNHDRTNSQQNPKLPSWALLDISKGPNADQAGDVKAAGFWDAQNQPFRHPEEP